MGHARGNETELRRMQRRVQALQERERAMEQHTRRLERENRELRGSGRPSGRRPAAKKKRKEIPKEARGSPRPSAANPTPEHAAPAGQSPPGVASPQRQRADAIAAQPGSQPWISVKNVQQEVAKCSEPPRLGRLDPAAVTKVAGLPATGHLNSCADSLRWSGVTAASGARFASSPTRGRDEHGDLRVSAFEVGGQSVWEPPKGRRHDVAAHGGLTGHVIGVGEAPADPQYRADASPRGGKKRGVSRSASPWPRSPRPAHTKAPFGTDRDMPVHARDVPIQATDPVGQGSLLRRQDSRKLSALQLSPTRQPPPNAHELWAGSPVRVLPNSESRDFPRRGRITGPRPQAQEAWRDDGTMGHPFGLDNQPIPPPDRPSLRRAPSARDEKAAGASGGISLTHRGSRPKARVSSAPDSGKDHAAGRNCILGTGQRDSGDGDFYSQNFIGRKNRSNSPRPAACLAAPETAAGDGTVSVHADAAGVRRTREEMHQGGRTVARNRNTVAEGPFPGSCRHVPTFDIHCPSPRRIREAVVGDGQGPISPSLRRQAGPASAANPITGDGVVQASPRGRISPSPGSYGCAAAPYGCVHPVPYRHQPCSATRRSVSPAIGGGAAASSPIRYARRGTVVGASGGARQIAVSPRDNLCVGEMSPRPGGEDRVRGLSRGRGCSPGRSPRGPLGAGSAPFAVDLPF